MEENLRREAIFRVFSQNFFITGRVISLAIFVQLA